VRTGLMNHCPPDWVAMIPVPVPSPSKCVRARC
jgi:hypothetical protein